MKRTALLLFLAAMATLAQAQPRWATAHADSLLPKRWRGAHKVAGPLGAQRWAADLRQDLIARGWLEASCDTIDVRGDTAHCHVHLGRPYRWASLRNRDVPGEIASAAHFRERLYATRPVSPRQLARLFEDLLAECEENGHPFARTWLDSVHHASDGLYARLRMDRGPFVRIDSVIVRGEARIAPRYLRAHIGISPGDPYNEQLVAAVERRIRELPFVSQQRQPYVLFTQEMTKLHLFLEPRKASSFNGILGVQPDAITGRVRLTGDLDLRLRNALKRGEALDLNWRSLADRTQDLKVRTNFPFVFNTPFGTDLSLKLFKRDTTFLEVTARAALEYLLGRGDKVSVFVSDKGSQRLGRTFTAAPGLGDVKITAYGMGVQRERFDYRFNPRQGLGVELDGSVGRKRSTTSVPGDDVITYVTNTQYEGNARIVWHVPLGRRATLRMAGQGGTMINNGTGARLYRNEVYRIGGLKTLRGTDEAGIFASSYAIGTVEYRFLFEENSNFFVFVDQAWWEDRSLAPAPTDTPLGFGAGTSFETKAGIFSITYALGRQFDNPVELRGGKVHFGFSSLF